MEFAVKGVTEADLTELGQLFDDLNDHLEATINYPKWKKGVYPTQNDAKPHVDKGLFVLWFDSKIVGSICLNHVQEEAYAQATWGMEAFGSEVLVIRMLTTHPNYLRMGVSCKLLDFAKHHANAIGAKTIRLDVTQGNSPAIALYKKCGYTYAGTVDLGLPYDGLKWFELYELIL